MGTSFFILKEKQRTEYETRRVGLGGQNHSGRFAGERENAAEGDRDTGLSVYARGFRENRKDGERGDYHRIPGAGQPGSPRISYQSTDQSGGATGG